MAKPNQLGECWRLVYRLERGDASLASGWVNVAMRRARLLRVLVHQQNYSDESPLAPTKWWTIGPAEKGKEPSRW
jgi:hypothetical protein